MIGVEAVGWGVNNFLGRTRLIQVTLNEIEFNEV
jgi:hypothetical protein